jgi:hypothetical protein
MLRLRLALGGLACCLLSCMKAGAPAGVPTMVVPVMAVSGPGISILGEGKSGKAAHDADGRAVGDRVEVELHGSWFPAVLLERRGDKWLVRADRHGDESDEIVEREHIRMPLEAAPDDFVEDDGDP